jgi:hypothetical protein
LKPLPLTSPQKVGLADRILVNMKTAVGVFLKNIYLVDIVNKICLDRLRGLPIPFPGFTLPASD